MVLGRALDDSFAPDVRKNVTALTVTRLGATAERVADALGALEVEGRVIRGEFRPATARAVAGGGGTELISGISCWSRCGLPKENRVFLRGSGVGVSPVKL